MDSSSHNIYLKQKLENFLDSVTFGIDRISNKLLFSDVNTTPTWCKLGAKNALFTIAIDSNYCCIKSGYTVE